MLDFSPLPCYNKGEVSLLFVEHWIKTNQKIPVGMTLQFFDREEDNECFATHIQNTLEILCSINGHVTVEVNDRPFLLSPGDILLINPLDKHRGDFYQGRYAAYYCLYFDIKHFLSVLPHEASERMHAVLCGSGRFQTKIPAADKNADPLRALLPGMQRIAFSPDPVSETRMIGQVAAVIAELLPYYREHPCDVNRSFDFIRRVSAYIEKHYTEPITTAEVAQALSYSKSYFCRRFRESYGCNFCDYLYRFRISEAARLRREPGLSLGEIAARAGFSDYAYFSRTFRRYMGVTPKDYFNR